MHVKVSSMGNINTFPPWELSRIILRNRGNEDAMKIQIYMSQVREMFERFQYRKRRQMQRNFFASVQHTLMDEIRNLTSREF